MDVYTNAACKYPYAEDVYLMLPSFLYHWECVEVVQAEGDEAGDMHVNFPDTSDVRLLTSRDGVSWDQAPWPASVPAGGPEGRFQVAPAIHGPRFREGGGRALELLLRL